MHHARDNQYTLHACIMYITQLLSTCNILDVCEWQATLALRM